MQSFRQYLVCPQLPAHHPLLWLRRLRVNHPSLVHHLLLAYHPLLAYPLPLRPRRWDWRPLVN